MKGLSPIPNARRFKGIILTAGSGSRLYPITLATSKPLLPIYDKPMIYYPLSVLMLAGIRDILIICSPEDISRYKFLLKDGSQLGICISYAEQSNPEGIAQAFIIGAEFIGENNVCLILGDNIFYGHGFTEILVRAAKMEKGCLIFGYRVNDPERYGVVEFDKTNKVLSIEEKPKKPKSNYAVAGLYFFDNHVIEIASGLKPSAREELEIADVVNVYLKRGELSVELLGRGAICIDAGTHESLMEASAFIKTIEKRQGLKVACIEEIAYWMGYIDKKQVKRLAEPFVKNDYGQYLLRVVDEE